MRGRRLRTLDRFLTTDLTERALKETDENYRSLEPGSYLYKKILKYRFARKFSDEFIELLYVTLTAWNMNSRGAKLQDYERLKESIFKTKKMFLELDHYSLKDINNQKVRDILKKLFFELDLVSNGKPPLVTFSKTMHFMLPDLIGPIDRKYTLQYFYQNTYVPKSIEKQFERFMEIEKAYSVIAQKIQFEKYRNSNWNSSIPKMVDNTIIGYMKLELKRSTKQKTVGGIHE